MKSVVQVKREEDANDPPIEANQIWQAFGSNHEVLREWRILAQMPEPTGYREPGRAWIVEEKPDKMRRHTEIFKVSEFNLRYVFRMKRDKK